MTVSRFDIDSAVDRLMFVNGKGHMIGLPTRPGTSSTATTGVPTDGIAGFAPGAVFHNYKASSAGTMLYVNVGTATSATWRNLDTPAGIGAVAVAGVAAGYKIARGVTALDGSNPTPVTTGLTTVVAATVTLEGTAAPGVGTSVLTVASTNYATGALAVYAWKPTASGDCTLIASTGTENFEWIAVGT